MGRARLGGVFRNPHRQVLVEVGIFLGGTLQSAVHQAEGILEIPAGARGRGGLVALCCCEPLLHLGRCAVRPAEAVLQPPAADLPRKDPQPEHVLRKSSTVVPPRRVVAGDHAHLCLCRLRHQPGEEDLHHGASAGPQGNPQRLIPGREVSDQFLDCLGLVWQEEP